MKELLKNIELHSLPHFSNKNVDVSILRLDMIHRVVSGNKWFKLQYYLQDALDQKKNKIATFGGPYSNHIVATAYTAQQFGLRSVGFIRGDCLPTLNHTLLQAKEYGMEIRFVDRLSYLNKEKTIEENNDPDFYWIMEGGYGKIGAKGASEILSGVEKSQFTHILCATGTGTMMAGLLKSTQLMQQVVGISVLKNNLSLEKEIRLLLNEDENQKGVTLINDYHFGGYAKHPQKLINFMTYVWEKEKVPTDIVYTSKLLYATKDLIEKKYFPDQSRLLIIHSGGLQGNNSLKPGRLPF